MPAALAGYGGISLFGWLFSAIGAFFLAKVFSNLSKLLPGISGGPYAYTHAAFGDFAGFVIAWGYWISVWCSNAALAVSFVGGLSSCFKGLQQNPPLEIATGLSAIWLLTWVNSLGIKATGNTQLILTILKLLPLLFVALGGIFFIHFSNFIPFNISGTSNLQAITATGALTFFAFLGVECATIPAGNVINPQKTIPRATILGTVITTIVYILVTVVVMGMIPAVQLQNSATPLADAAAVIGGEKAKYFVGAGVALAAFGALNGWILVQGQIPNAIAKDKLFPGVFKKENKNGMPAMGIAIGSILASVLMYMNYNNSLVKQYTFLSLISTLTSLVPYLFCAAAYAIIAVAKKQLSTRKWPAAIALASISFVFSLWSIIGAPQDVVYWGFILLMSGVPFYVWIIYKKSKDGAAIKEVDTP